MLAEHNTYLACGTEPHRQSRNFVNGLRLVCGLRWKLIEIDAFPNAV